MGILKQGFIKFYLFYLRVLARIQLRKINPVVIGVGGSSGKTSTATILSIILSKKFSVKNSSGKNSETGIPLTILGIEVKNYSYPEWVKIFFIALFKVILVWKKYEIFVSEMGIDSPVAPKNMEYLLSIVKPRIGVVTNINPEHSQYFDYLVKEVEEVKRREKILNLIAEQELLLLRSIRKDGFSVINIDDPKIKEIYKKNESSFVTVSKVDPTADFFIESREVSLGKYLLKFNYKTWEHEIKLKRPLPAHYDYSLIFSIAIAHILGITIEESIKNIEERFLLPPGRVSIFRGIKNSLIIDSSYNSNIETVSDLLELLSEIAGNRRKVAIVGDMREQGSLSKAQHEELARSLIPNTDVAVLIGPMLENFTAPILNNENFNYYSFPNFSKAKTRIKALIRNQDIVLVKGSQNTLFLERAVEMLLRDPEDEKFLARRGKFWDKMRIKTP